MNARLIRVIFGLLLFGLAAVALGIWWIERDESLPSAPTAEAFVATPQQIERGAYLARACN